MPSCMIVNKKDVYTFAKRVKMCENAKSKCEVATKNIEILRRRTFAFVNSHFRPKSKSAKMRKPARWRC